MGLFLVRRLLLAVVIVVVAVTLLYVMIHAVPGDPAAIILGPQATPELMAALREKMGLNEPFLVQIATFFADVLRGDLGTDIITNRPVATIVLEQLPYTLILIVAAITWAAIIGIPLGAYSAIRRNTLIDKFTGVFSVGTIAIPSFVVALYALLIFAVWLNWLPAIGAGERGDPLDQARHLILPAFAVGVSWIGYIARVVRASMLEVLSENHVRMARAFGLSEARVVFSYALPIAVLPTITLIGVGIAHLLSAAVFAEIVFARPGIGKLTVDAVTTRNYPVVMGTVLVTTGLFVVSTTLADVVNALLDPRVREKL